MIQKRLQDTNMQIYVVKQGDTVDTIAGEYGVSVEDIIYDNQIPYPTAWQWAWRFFCG